MKIINLIWPVFIFTLISCGGGGGGGSDTPFYGGVWYFTGIKLIDDCNSGVSGTFSTNLTVNQVENRVVVDSGRVVLTGTTNDDDGFTVTNRELQPNGCWYEWAYSFVDASDGEADAGLAMVITCGAAQCTVGYGGTATKRSGKSYGGEIEFNLEELCNDISNGIVSKQFEGNHAILSEDSELLAGQTAKALSE